MGHTRSGQGDIGPVTTPLFFADAVLSRAGYACWRAELDSVPALGFEDTSLVGFIFEYPSAAAIVDGWRAAEEGMIKRHSRDFRRAGEKAWNVYCAFLTASSATPAECRQLRTIEEDLEQTRKLMGTSQTDEAAVSQALLPILPMTYSPQLGTFDAEARLARRLDGLVPGISNLLLNDAIEPEQVLQHLSSQR